MEYRNYGIDVPEDASGEYCTVCPECSGTRKKKNVKCLSVNVEKGVWHCNHCGFSGSLKGGRKNYGQPHYLKPVIEYRKPGYSVSKCDDKLSEDPAIKYLVGRGILMDVIIANNIEVRSVYMPQLEDFTKVLCFPFFRGEEVVNVKYRDGHKNFRTEVGCERIFYGMRSTRKSIVIVEGEIDKLTVEAAGFTSWSVPDGAPSPTTKDYSSKFEFLENCAKEIAVVETFVLAVDNDPPGKVLEAELARRLGYYRCKRVKWPEGCKDANDVAVKHGYDKLREYIEKAEEYPVVGLKTVADFNTELDDLYDIGARRGESTGFFKLDEYYTVKPGQLTVVTGIPSHGKSEFLDAIAVNLAAKGWIFGIFSPENQPLQLHGRKLAEKVIGKPFGIDHNGRMTETELAEAKDFIFRHFIFILPDDEDQITLDKILELAKIAVMKRGINGLVIDPWNEIDHTRPDRLNETEYISSCLTKLRAFARKYNVHVWLVAHPAKLFKGKDGIYPVPTLYDISGSAHWFNKTDNGIVIYRNVTTGTDKTEIHIPKIRFKDNGKPGFTVLNYNRANGRFT